jgi:hypothetical protein
MREKNLLKCRGSFVISDKMFKDYPKHIMNILSQFLITRCEYVFDTQSFYYIAVSYLFDEIDDSMPAPMYSIEVENVFDEKTKEEKLILKEVTRDHLRPLM